MSNSAPDSSDKLAPVPDPGVDAHVHVMPDGLMQAIRGALDDAAGWTFDHPTAPDAIEDRLAAAGVERFFALPYAHKPGIATELNEWVLEQAADSERAIPFATVHGDDDVEAVVSTAVDAGARGLKFQCPVQGCGPADPRLDPAFELATAHDLPIVFHAGTAPMFEESPHVGADQFESFLESYPDVRVCAAHMGAYEVDAFLAFARDYENVYLDTTVAMASVAPAVIDFDPATISDDVLEELSASIMYGSDYPNIPYPYAREREHLLSRSLSPETRRDLFGRTAERFLGE
ncbi:amidohydrolase family protein [Natronolimnohabitans sp. A-GB9]|uniref:amidohydrolase family protein n=1 Tax=Natronolimnohabitans sp. A-GB9 TaxID=3069757 RepID=UPI0027B52663|nr:amidohydrolase family protein [Natronolimnohabitans sp. A-GB9]MDQ2052935.1 amidohydrolase family protein [Natronolimnohabitans sp. A-GB9]